MIEDFDFKNPDYVAVFKKRAEVLARIRAQPDILPALKSFYRENPAQFISDWGITYNSKNLAIGRPAYVPFILFPRQVEFVESVMRKWKLREPLLAEKTRQMGFSWLIMAIGCTLCLFNEGMAIGVGSRKEDLVDKIGDPKSLFHKGRTFMDWLPPEFRGGWEPGKNSAHMRLTFPQTDASIMGEAGDNIGRGATTAIYFVDESAFIERPQLVDASLSQATSCRIDVSTPNGMANTFYEKRLSGLIEVFTCHWRDDPTKDQAWYDKEVRDIANPVVVAQELDIDYAASVEGVLIPSAWVQASIDAHIKLGILPSGDRAGALDIADEGKDKNAFCGAYGILLDHIEEWSGVGDDIFKTMERAFLLCDTMGYNGFKYDADGLGAGARGDARIINERRKAAKMVVLPVDAFRGSEGVLSPEAQDVKGRTNQDFFANRKAQAWWSLRERFKRTYRWVVEREPCGKDEIISISSKASGYVKLCAELSQPTFGVNGVGKIVVNKAPDNTKSPNLADAVMIRFASARRTGLNISADALARA